MAEASIVITLIAGVPIALIITLLVVLIPLSIRAERARRAALWQWATEHGWTFAENVRPHWISRLPGGRRERIGVMMTGKIGGRWVTVADYSYQTTSSSGDTTTTHTHHFIAVVVLLDRPLPPTAVHTRGAISKLGRSMFGDSPNATGDEWFDAQFRIATADPDYGRWLVGKPLRDAHVAGAVPTWSIAGQELLTYTPGQLHHPDTIPTLAAPLNHVADLLGR
ncbi:hypothetical protein [Nocardia nepalensis]|uniref:hypothetical protein n=1 Tax=Nocardia nepalensis TaxID=3375448 RepID=UPI003B685479